MPSTYSPSLKIELIGNGEQTGTWGDTTNNNLGTLIEQAITGVGAITLTGDTVLTNYNGLTDQSRNAVLVFSGALANSANITAPSVEKTYVVVNNSGANVTLKTTSGTGITLANNTSQLVYCDGAEFYTALNVNTVTGDMTVTGSETVGGSFIVGGQITFDGNVVSLTNSLSFTSYAGIIDASANTGALVAPTGTTAQRPGSPALGTARWNTTLGWYEIWNGSAWVSITGTYAVSYLIVAGGAGGGAGTGGGGGAGGLLSNTTTVTAGTNYTITVGSGGSVGSGSVNGTNGANSTAFSQTAIGGGGGGNAGASNSGSAGGSGGGAGQTVYEVYSPGGAGTSGQGYAGGYNYGTVVPNAGGGGGGGAGAVGQNGLSSRGGNGGIGNASTITGTSVYYAGGGGGGSDSGGSSGGSGGGGSQGSGGTANTGGGGGAGGSGGSGVVILSYTASYQRGTGGTVTSYSSGGNTYYVHTFTSSGTFTA